ncbi:MAG TPA: hypothetical protein VMY35_02505 [Phycisphaerae bacterium]|nr:hypothetical protein [Phycisphaerae bacterium]
MSTVFGVTQLCDAASIAADSTAHAQTGASCPVFEEGVVILTAASSAAVNLSIALQVSADGTTWYTSYVHDLQAAQARDIQAAAVVVAGASPLNEAALLLKNAAPWVRIVPTNNGAAAVTLTAQLITR